LCANILLQEPLCQRLANQFGFRRQLVDPDKTIHAPMLVEALWVNWPTREEPSDWSEDRPSRRVPVRVVHLTGNELGADETLGVERRCDGESLYSAEWLRAHGSLRRRGIETP